MSEPAPSTGSAPSATTLSGDRQEAVARAVEDVLLAREQARLGLTAEAAAAWNRAVTTLQPVASRDAQIAEQMRQIEAERDQALKDAEVRADLEDTDNDATEAAASQEILGNPEPALDPTLLPEVGKAAQEITGDYPLVLNDQVYAWLETWTRGLRQLYAGSLERSGMYTERFRQIFAEEGLPQDLVYLAHVESSFKTSAYSPAAARGIFQFIAETGRRYGLVTNWWLDERADPEKSCRASAAYLRDLYAEFGDWYMALAAYNCGEGRIRQVIARTGSKDFFNPANLRLLPLATRNYVPAIIAATIISKDPAKFGFGDVVPAKALQFETVTVPGPTSVAVLAGVAKTDPDTLHALNPSLRRHSTPPAYKDFVLKVPVGSAQGFAERLAAIPPDQRLVQQEHLVRRGETINTIARKYGVSTRAIAEANQLGRRPRLHPGMSLVVPDGPDSAPDPSPRVASAKSAGGYYTVRKGDHLTAIANRFHVSVKSLQTWNKIDGYKLAAGQKLRVSAPTAAAPDRAVASVKKPASPTAPASPAVKSARATAGRSHVVKRGETLYKISQQYGVAVADIVSVNKLGRSARIHPGQKLIIPARVADADESAPKTSAVQHAVHVVRAGETLRDIARESGLTVETLCSLNSIPPDARLAPGATVALAR